MPEVDPSSPQVPLRTVVDVLPRAVVVADGDGRIAVWNAKAAELFGWEEHEVLGRDVLDVLVPQVVRTDDVEERYRDVRSGGSTRGDRTVLHRSGEPILIWTATVPIVDERGQVQWLVGASEDVGALRRAEERQRELNEHLRLALDAADLGTWQWDMATGAVVWDERMEALFGFEPGSFDGTFEAYAAALHPDDREEVLGRVDRAVATRARYRVEHRVVLPDGGIRWIHGAGQVTVDPDGKVTGAIGCCMDVTDRMQARLEAEAAAARARRAAERERTDRERLEFLTAINEALAEARTREEIMVRVTRAAVPRLGDWCSIFVLPEEGGRVPDVETFHVDPAMVGMARELMVRYPFDPEAPNGMPAVIRTGTPEFYPEITEELVDDVLEQAGYEDEEVDELRNVVGGLQLRSSIAVPLVKLGKVVGGLSFVTTTARRGFTQLDLELAQVVAGRVASSLENRRLADAERRIAVTLQASLLPESLPEIVGLDVAVRYWAAGEQTVVGGDFYDLFEVDGERWAGVVGDVCGTGPAAASLTSLARHTIRQAAWRDDDPTEVLAWLNRAVLTALGPARSFLTAAFFTLDRADDGFDLTLTCAGHPPPVLVRASGEAGAVGDHGTLLGALPRLDLNPVHRHLASGDTLVLYTDGLTDVPPPHGLSTAQTVELVAAATRDHPTAEAVAKALEGAVQERLVLQDRPDDIAVVVLRAR